jgi:hypothetical protein
VGIDPPFTRLKVSNPHLHCAGGKPAEKNEIITLTVMLTSGKVANKIPPFQRMPGVPPFIGGKGEGRTGERI